MILFDVYHLPQWNFFRNVVATIPSHERVVACVDRGRLRHVIGSELNGGELVCIGSYRFNWNRLAMILLIIVPRTLRLAFLMRRRNVRFVVSANYQSNVAARLLGIPNIVFNDDPRRGVIQLARWAADKTFMTKGLKLPGTIEVGSLKEWTYLSPKYFKPDPGVLEEYGVTPFRYYLLREVSVQTTNYSRQRPDQLLTLEPDTLSFPVLLSLEDKSKRDSVPPHWRILEEPVRDIYSLIFYSRGLVSTGDSMAREAAQLGVPAFYVGSRKMAANQILADLGLLRHANIREAMDALEASAIGDADLETDRRQLVRQTLFESWDDINELILEQVRKHL